MIARLRASIEAIKSLRWADLGPAELQQVMILSGFAAREFAESLRLALKRYPDSTNLRSVGMGELQTKNLQFGDYERSGDHADFLWHFIGQNGLIYTCPREVVKAGVHYENAVHALPAHLRVMSIFSRERELPGIFSEILRAKNWEAPGLSAYRYYLERHIVLDSQRGGHGELLSGFTVDESVTTFYEIRLELYRCVSTLFRQ